MKVDVVLAPAMQYGSACFAPGLQVVNALKVLPRSESAPLGPALAPAVAQIARIARQMGIPRRIGAQVIALGLVAAGVSLPAPAAAQGPGPVLVVGDSLEVGTEPYLRQELGGVDLTVDAKTSRPSGDGIPVLQSALRPDHEVVVFDLGTNDDPSNPGGLTANLESAAQIAGDRCLVVATINRPPLNGVSDDGLNAAVENFAAATGARVADWRSAASEPGALQDDGVHGTASGYALRASLVAGAIRSCAAGTTSAGGGGGGPALLKPAKPVKAPPPPELGPGLALLAAPVLAIVDRAAAILGFARAAIAAAGDALHSAVELGGRVVRRIGELPVE